MVCDQCEESRALGHDICEGCRKVLFEVCPRCDAARLEGLESCDNCQKIFLEEIFAPPVPETSSDSDSPPVPAAKAKAAKATLPRPNLLAKGSSKAAAKTALGPPLRGTVGSTARIIPPSSRIGRGKGTYGDSSSSSAGRGSGSVREGSTSARGTNSVQVQCPHCDSNFIIRVSLNMHIDETDL